jgi:hypothetical protein
MLHALERDDRIVYYSSPAIASALLVTGWTLKDSGHRPTLVEDLAADLPLSTKDNRI